MINRPVDSWVSKVCQYISFSRNIWHKIKRRIQKRKGIVFGCSITMPPPPPPSWDSSSALSQCHLQIFLLWYLGSFPEISLPAICNQVTIVQFIVFRNNINFCQNFWFWKGFVLLKSLLCFYCFAQLFSFPLKTCLQQTYFPFSICIATHKILRTSGYFIILEFSLSV